MGGEGVLFSFKRIKGRAMLVCLVSIHPSLHTPDAARLFDARRAILSTFVGPKHENQSEFRLGNCCFGS